MLSLTVAARPTARRVLLSGILAASFFLLCVSPSRSWAVGPVATKAVCGKGDRPETGLQGQVSAADRAPPGPFRAWNCNLELQGHAEAEGAALGMVSTDKCAYYSQWHSTNVISYLENPGVAVVDVSSSSSPKVLKYLQTPAMLDSNSSLTIHHGRKLLLAQAQDQALHRGKTTDIYDISDCLNPVLKFSGIIPGFIYHSGDFSPDGMTVWSDPAEEADATIPRVPSDPKWGSQFEESNTIFALDVSDPTSPRLIARWKSEEPAIRRFHHVSTNDDGNLLYIAIGRFMQKDRPKPRDLQGMGVLDISQVQARKPNATIKMVGEPLYWSETDHNQHLRVMTIKGRKYVWQTDLDGSIPAYQFSTLATGKEHVLGKSAVGAVAFKGYDKPPPTMEEACAEGRPGWGHVQIIDVEDPTRLSRVSSLKLQVHEPKNCLATAYEPRFSTGYGSYICDVDNYQDAKMIACTFREGGVRVFDIRDVKRPRELAYYKPPGVGHAPRKASIYQTFRDIPGADPNGPRKFHGVDPTSNVLFANNARELWLTSYDNGFQVLRFSDELRAREADIFGRDVTCGGTLRGPHGCPEEK